MRFLAVTAPKRRWRIPEGFVRFCAVTLTSLALIFGSLLLVHRIKNPNTAEAATVGYADSVTETKLTDLLKKEPDALRNLSGHDVLAALNEPAMKRTEGDSHIWQYKEKTCILDIFLGGADEADAHVVHYEVRPHQVASSVKPNAAAPAPDARGCVTALLDKGGKSLAQITP